MARLRFNNSLGTLGASLTNSGTTITFSSAPSFPTVNSGDYIPLPLEPASGSAPSSNFEVAWLTAYTAGGTTGTIQRGCEGTTAVAHASNVIWTHGPTAWDEIFGKGADAPPLGDRGKDYEFLTPATYSGSSLPSGWSWVNQITGATYTEYMKQGTLYVPNGGSADHIVGIVRTPPSVPFTVSAKLAWNHQFNASSTFCAVGLYDGTKIIVFGYVSSGSNFYLQTIAYNNTGSWNSTPDSVGQIPLPSEYPYLQIAYTSSSNVAFSYSRDGINWMSHLSGYNPGGLLGTVTGIGIFGDGNGAPGYLNCEWFRVR